MSLTQDFGKVEPIAAAVNMSKSFSAMKTTLSLNQPKTVIVPMETFALNTQIAANKTPEPVPVIRKQQSK